MCVIDHYNKIIFVAVPKTGTTSTELFLEKILKNNNGIIQNKNKKKDIGLRKHASALSLKKNIENYDDYHKIAVVRNPYDWYVSWYTYRKREGAKVSSSDITFNEYINGLAKEHKDIFDFITDEDDNIIVDHILKYEDNIEVQITELLSKLLNIKIDYNFPKKNISKARKQKEYQEFYDEETKDIVAKLQRKTIEYFGYEF